MIVGGAYLRSYVQKSVGNGLGMVASMSDCLLLINHFHSKVQTFQEQLFWDLSRPPVFVFAHCFGYLQYMEYEYKCDCNANKFQLIWSKAWEIRQQCL